MRPRYRVAVALLALAGLLTWDLSTKSWAASELRARGGRTVAWGHVVLHYHENRGIAFGWLRENKRQPLIVGYNTMMALALAGLLGHRLALARSSGPLVVPTLVLLLAGTLGNLHDRLERGFVVDFIDWGGGRVRFPIFNIADVLIAAGITLGLTAVILGVVRSSKGPRATRRSPAALT